MPQEKPIIEAKEINVRDLLMNRFFEIPLYQRPFSWNEENFQELVDDIRDAIDSEEENLFSWYNSSENRRGWNYL